MLWAAARGGWPPWLEDSEGFKKNTNYYLLIIIIITTITIQISNSGAQDFEVTRRAAGLLDVILSLRVVEVYSQGIFGGDAGSLSGGLGAHTRWEV